jgi:hypothetical protein
MNSASNSVILDSSSDNSFLIGEQISFLISIISSYSLSSISFTFTSYIYFKPVNFDLYNNVFITYSFSFLNLFISNCNFFD